MVDFNALIVWKTLIDICFSIKSSLWALTAAYTKFRRMIWSMIWSCATGHVPWCVLLPHRHTGRLHLEKAVSIPLCYFQVGQVTTGAEAPTSQRVNKKPHNVVADYDHRLMTEILNAEVTICNSKLQLPDIHWVCVQTWTGNMSFVYSSDIINFSFIILIVHIWWV